MFCRVLVGFLLLGSLSTAPCQAEKRALLIGINDYAPPQGAASPVAGEGHAADSRFSGGGHWQSLRGPAEDVAAMHVLLREKFGFREDSIRVLEETDATREGILAALDKLVAETKPGDLVVFYYSGHGSRRLDTLSSKNHLDETIVPIDAWKGAKDIRDKEMALRFDRMVYDRQAHLTAIFDSCNSGTMARGITASVQRALAYDDRDVAEDKKHDPATVTEADLKRIPQDGDAIVLSAAAANEYAQEAVYPDDGKPHGAFTRALVMVLKSHTQTLSAEDVVAEVSSILHADSPVPVPFQQPSVEGRLHQSLFGDPVAEHALHVRVGKVTEAGLTLDMGSAAGFDVGTQFRAIEAGAGGATTLIEVKSVEQPLASTAVVVEGPAVRVGAILELSKMVYPRAARLVIYAPKAGGAITPAQVERAKRMFPGLRWVDDPTAQGINFLVVQEEKGWVAYDQSGAARPAGPGLKGTGFVLLGPPRALIERMQKSPPFETKTFAFTQTLAEANYLLATRIGAGGKAEYALFDPAILTPHKADAWVTSHESDADDAALNGGVNPEIVCRNDVSLPVRTAWLGDKADGTGAALALTRRVVRLGKLRVWMKSAAMAPGVGDWPYRLAIAQPGSGAPLSGPLHLGAKYDVRLEAAPQALAAHRPDAKYVYLFGFDCSGNAVLLYPAAGQNGDGKTPQQGMDGRYPASVLLYRLPGVTEPVGADTIFMMATQEKLTDPGLVTNDGVLERGASRGAVSQMDGLMTDLNDAGTRGAGTTPGHWTVQQAVVASRP